MNLDKLKLDPFYYELYKKYGEQFIIDAGYFESSANKIDINENICTPIKFLDTNDINSDKFCVLVTTGSFAPIHSGHVDMMNSAKRQMEDKGYKVLGGYFCPDHDTYIQEKLGEEAILINERVKLIDKLTWAPENNWLTADPWMGLYCDADVNFTIVIDRLEKYINNYFYTEGIEIVFVCGEDRINFINTFKIKGRCVVVRRSNDFKNIKDYLLKELSELEEGKITKKEYDDFYNRVLFDLDNTNFESSTNIRKNKVKIFEKKSLILRYDSRESITLNKAIIDLLGNYYKDIKLYDIAKQAENFNKLGVKTISLDPMMKGTFNIPISRSYDNFGFKFLGFTIRPGENKLGASNIKEYINIISRNLWLEEYWLFDDDICGGATIKYVRDILEKRGVKIAGVITFLKSTGEEEVMDLRDLIIDHPYGGLVVNGKRLPYFYPWVDPYIRASIQNPEKFSKEIKFINDEYRNSIKNFQEKCNRQLEGI